MAGKKGVMPPQFAEHVMHKHRVMPGGHLGPAQAAMNDHDADERRLAPPKLGGTRGARKGR